MKSGFSLFIWIIFFVFVTIANLYGFWYLKYGLKYLLEDKEPALIAKYIENTFPRLWIEYKRLGIDEIRNIAHQLILRTDFVLLFLFILLRKPFSFNKIVSSIENIPALRNQKLIIKGYFSFLCIYLIDIGYDLLLHKSISAFYAPGNLLKVIFPEYPNQFSLIIILFIGIISCLLFIFVVNYIFGRLLAFISIIVFILLQLIAFSFEKTEHTYSSFNYFGLFICIGLLFINSNSKSQGNTSFYLNIGLLSVVLCYFFAGIEKVTLSGTHFLEPESFSYFLQLHKNKLSNFLVKTEHGALFTMLYVLVSQLFICWGLLFRQTRKVTALWFILFHISTWLVLGVGGLTSPWIAVLLLIFLFG